jgi:hypothetical protein
MHLPRRAAAAATATAIGLTALAGGGTAMAAPRGCAPNTSYSVSHVHRYFVTNKSTALQTAGPGGDRLTLAVKKGQDIHGKITGTGSFTIDDILVFIKVTISETVRFSWKTSAAGHSRPWPVPAHWAAGWLAFGSYGYQFDWKRERTDRGCTVEVLGHGTGKLPAKHFAFHHGRGIAPPETG